MIDLKMSAKNMGILKNNWIVNDRYLAEDARLTIENAVDRSLQKCRAPRVGEGCAPTRAVRVRAEVAGLREEA